LFEIAMSTGSEFIAPSLGILLEYYRDAGRDAEADVIRSRLRDHERAMEIAKQERLKVSRRDRFSPHGLSPPQLEKVRRILYRYPHVLDAYLVRKDVKLFTDKPSYVLGVHRQSRSLEDRSRADRVLMSCLSSDMEFACAVVLLTWTRSRLRSGIYAACPEPVYVSKD